MNLNRLLELTSDTFGRTRKDIIIKKDLADDLLPVDADYGQIEQVIMNLFVNAADAMPAGGTIFINTSNRPHTEMVGHIYEPKPGDYIMLTFQDNGVGMDTKKVLLDHAEGIGNGIALDNIDSRLRSIYGTGLTIVSEKMMGTEVLWRIPIGERSKN